MCQFFRPYKSKLKILKHKDYPTVFIRELKNLNSCDTLSEVLGRLNVCVSNNVYVHNKEYLDLLIESVRRGEINYKDALSEYYILYAQYAAKNKDRVSIYECQNCKRWYIDSIENADIKECVDCRH